MKKLFKKLKTRLNPKIVIATAIVIFLFFGVIYYGKNEGRIFIDNSLLSAPISSIAPSAPGKLTEMLVYEGQKINRGQALAIISGQTLYSDTDGLIAMTNNQIGSQVNPQSPVVQIINPLEMKVAGTLDENKGLDKIKTGQVASFTVDAFPGKIYWGYVDEISPTAKQTQLSFSISSERPTQQFMVYVRFNALKYPELKNGMSSKLTVYTNSR